MKGKIASLMCRLVGHRMRRDWVSSDSMQGSGRFEHRCRRCGRCLDDEYVSLYRPSSTRAWRRALPRPRNGSAAF